MRVAIPGLVVVTNLFDLPHALALLSSPCCAAQDNVFVVMVVSVQYQVMGGNLYDAFYRVSGCNMR